MPNATQISAPPYHVQSTAAELRNGFPYFSYHKSISKLWAEKWRPPCAKGIYPFTDSIVLDFDPKFAELVRISQDRSDILYQPDEYAKPFFGVAENFVILAEESETQGDTAKAKDLYLRAAAVYRIVRFSVNRSELSQRAWVKGKGAYVKGGRHLNPPSVAVEVPSNHANSSAGDKEVPIQTYLRMPAGTKPENGWPVLLFICGLDAYRTDHTPRTQVHVDRGFATLSFEIPGTGDCPAAANDPNSPDRLMSSILDWVSAHSTEYGFDLTNVVARGISTGGYYAMRIAHTIPTVFLPWWRKEAVVITCLILPGLARRTRWSILSPLRMPLRISSGIAVLIQSQCIRRKRTSSVFSIREYSTIRVVSSSSSTAWKTPSSPSKTTSSLGSEGIKRPARQGEPATYG
jgi:hypothetical protein